VRDVDVRLDVDAGGLPVRDVRDRIRVADAVPTDLWVDFRPPSPDRPL